MKKKDGGTENPSNLESNVEAVQNRKTGSIKLSQAEKVHPSELDIEAPNCLSDVYKYTFILNVLNREG